MTESSLLAALRELEETARRMPSLNPKPNLLPLLERIDSLGRQLPDDTAPDLIHYMKRQSYEKARLWLEGRDAENQRGACGH